MLHENDQRKLDSLSHPMMPSAMFTSFNSYEFPRDENEDAFCTPMAPIYRQQTNTLTEQIVFASSQTSMPENYAIKRSQSCFNNASPAPHGHHITQRQLSLPNQRDCLLLQTTLGTHANSKEKLFDEDDFFESQSDSKFDAFTGATSRDTSHDG